MTLFIGYPIDNSLEQALKKCTEFQKHLLEAEGYLQKWQTENQKYIGKIGTLGKIEEVVDFQKHVASLCKKVAPDYTFVENHFVLLAV